MLLSSSLSAASQATRPDSSTKAWGQLATQLVADIDQQPAMLTGGELRDYQMQASPSGNICSVQMIILPAASLV